MVHRAGRRGRPPAARWPELNAAGAALIGARSRRGHVATCAHGAWPDHYASAGCPAGTAGRGCLAPPPERPRDAAARRVSPDPQAGGRTNLRQETPELWPGAQLALYEARGPCASSPPWRLGPPRGDPGALDHPIPRLTRRSLIGRLCALARAVYDRRRHRALPPTLPADRRLPCARRIAGRPRANAPPSKRSRRSVALAPPAETGPFGLRIVQRRGA